MNHRPTAFRTLLVAAFLLNACVSFGQATLTVVPSSLSGFTTTAGTASAAQTCTLSGTALTGAPGSISVTAPAGYEVSLSSGSGFGGSLNVSYATATLSSTIIYSRIAATTPAGTASGNIAFSGGGAASPPTVALSGSVNCSPPGTQVTGGTVSNVATTTATLSFTAGTGSNRIVLLKSGSAVTDVPVDGTSYTGSAGYSGAGALGASKIVYAGTGTTVNITTLTPGTTYYYTAFEYNNSTKCYQLNGAPAGSFATVAASSDVVSAGGEAMAVSSLSNGAIASNTDGTQVWSFTVRDGGGAPDGDALPTIINSITLSRIGSAGPVADWTATINDAAIFSSASSMPIAHASIMATSLQFGSLSLTVPDDGSVTYTLRISLKHTLGATDDGRGFIFSLANGSFTTGGTGISSQKTAFSAAQSASGKNIVDVAATMLSFSQQPTDGGINQVMTPAVKVIATDANGNTDLGYTGNVSITSAGTLSGTPVVAASAAGLATFSALIHTAAGTGLALTASATGLASAVSAVFNEYVVTAFRGGDVAIVAMNTDANQTTPLSANDEISIAAFVDIVPYTAFFLTDNGYERAAAGRWGNSEGVLQITRLNSNVPAGRVFTIAQDAGNGYHFYLCGGNDDANWSITSVAGMGSGLDVSATDQLWITQGGVWTPGTSQMATYSGSVLCGWTGSGWQSAPGFASASGSTIVPEAACFTTNVGGSASKAKFNYAAFSAAKDKYAWVNTISPGSNWTTYTTNTTYNSGGTDFLGNTSCVDLSINATTAVAGKWAGSSGNHNWFDCANWQTLKVPDSTTAVVIDNIAQYAAINNTATAAALYSSKAYAGSLSISAGNTLSLNNANGLDALQIAGNMTVAATGAFDPGNGTLTIAGNINNQSTVGSWAAAAGSTIVLNGNGPQTISAASATISAPFEVYNLKLSKSAGSTTLSAPLRISGQATFTTGELSTTTGAPLLFADNATTSGASAASYVAGPVRKTGNHAFVFPIGKAGHYCPAGISAPALVADAFTAEYFNAPYATQTVTALSGLDHVSTKEYWDVARTAGSSNVDVTLTWGPSSGVDASLVSTLRLAHFNGVSWDNLGVSSSGASSITKTGVSSFSPFTLGTTSAAQPLPLRLLSFDGTRKEGAVMLNWMVACEAEIARYDVEQSLDGRTFAGIGSVIAGNSGCSSDGRYTYNARTLYTDIAYRLAIQSNDGSVTYSPVRFFHDNTPELKLQLTPNPAREVLLIDGFAGGTAWRIIDSYGREAQRGITDGSHTVVALTSMAAGLYFLHTSDGQIARFIKN